MKIGFPLLLLCFVLSSFPADFGQERMSAFHETILSSFENWALPGIFTYDHDPRYWLHNIALGKWRIGVETSKGIVWLYEGRGQRVVQTPEELVITARVGIHEVEARLFPIMCGRDTKSWEGASGFIVRCRPEARIIVEFGAPGRVRIHAFGSDLPFRWQYLQDPSLVLGRVEWKKVDEGRVIAPIEGTTLFVSAWGKGEARLRGDWTRWEGEGEMEMVVAFSEKEERAEELTRKNVKEEEENLNKHYKRLFESAWMHTPVKELDEAFRCALWNLEFTWVRPWGWIEAVHHWGTLYSQQHSLAGDWVGQVDRSREMLLTHAQHILPSGQVPQLDTYGRARVDFGGWNQFYVWDIQHHWRMTADIDFARAIYPTLCRVIQQTFSAHDPDGNGLLGFGQQIGNQEDYISTPEDGTSPTIAGIEMLRTQMEIARALGKIEEARAAERKAKWMEEELRRNLWEKELGWFIFYRDYLGVRHLEPPYHSLIWPVLYGLLDPLDSYTSLRHLLEALQGKEGEIYVSNLFPSPVVSTTGAQAGGQQQPWATLVLCPLGFGEEGLRPLLWIARLVLASPHDGAWPEIGPEPTRSYFSPPSALYIQGVIEGIFGLSVDKPRGEIWIRPGFPQSWGSAHLHLPEYEAIYQREGNELRLRIISQTPLARRLRWALPVSQVEEVKVNGKKVGYRLQPLVNRVLLICDVPAMRESEFLVRIKPLRYEIRAPKEAVEGEEFVVKGEGVQILAVEDRQGVGEAYEIKGDMVKVRLRSHLRDLAERYGMMGEKLFSHRTLFLKCRVEGVEFWSAVDFRVLLPLRVEAKEEVWGSTPAIGLRIRNNSSLGLKGRWELRFSGEEPSLLVQGFSLNLEPASEWNFLVPLPPKVLSRLTPSENPFTLILPNGRTMPLTISFSRVLQGLEEEIRGKTYSVPLPEETLLPDGEWRSFRWWSAYGHPPWNALRPPLEGITGDSIDPDLPGIRFVLPKGRRLAVVSYWMGHPSLRVKVGKEARKVYLLIVPFLDHQDAFSPVGKVVIECGDGAVFSRELHFPGDLDWWAPPSIIGDFATYGKGWAKSVAIQSTTSILNVKEINLGKMRQVDWIEVSTLGRYPALGLLAITLLQ